MDIDNLAKLFEGLTLSAEDQRKLFQISEDYLDEKVRADENYNLALREAAIRRDKSYIALADRMRKDTKPPRA